LVVFCGVHGRIPNIAIPVVRRMMKQYLICSLIFEVAYGEDLFSVC
jgi:hypothetical protein